MNYQSLNIDFQQVNNQIDQRQQNLQNLLQPKDQLYEPWFESYLDREFRGLKMSFELIRRRNNCFLALFMQTAASLTGFLFYFIRRTPLYLIINSLSLLVTYIGTYGVLRMEKYRIVFHSIMTTSVTGTFFLYCILEAFFQHEQENKNEYLMKEKNIILFLSIPYVFDFIAGAYTFQLAFELFQMYDEKNEALGNQNNQQFEIRLPENFNQSENQCIICLDHERDAFFYKCGHKIACWDCSTRIKRQYLARCPICRELIQDIVKVYDA